MFLDRMTKKKIILLPALSPAYLPPQTIPSPATQLVFAVWRTKWERGNSGVWQHFPTVALGLGCLQRGGTVASPHTPGLGDGPRKGHSTQSLPGVKNWFAVGPQGTPGCNWGLRWKPRGWKPSSVKLVLRCRRNIQDGWWMGM